MYNQAMKKEEINPKSINTLASPSQLCSSILVVFTPNELRFVTV